MKKLNITKKQFGESKYFTRKYGTLKYVSESGNAYKTDKGHILKFNENSGEVQCDGCGETCHEDEVEIVNDQVLCGKCRDVKNESHDDIDNDPSYECPNCGSHNCEFMTATDLPDNGYFEGSKIHGTFICLDCEQDYDVEYTLTVTNVTSI